MTDVVNLFQTKIDEANTQNKCGFCWQFEAGREDYTNLIRKEDTDQCCVYFLLEEWHNDCIYSKDRNDFASRVVSENIKFKALVAVDSDFTRQFYAEVDKDDIPGSKYESYLKDLQVCIKEVLDDNFCSTIFPAGFKNLKTEYAINRKDQNLDGYYVSGTITRWYE